MNNYIKRRGRVSRQVYVQPSVRQLYESDPSSLLEGTQDQPFALIIFRFFHTIFGYVVSAMQQYLIFFPFDCDQNEGCS